MAEAVNTGAGGATTKSLWVRGHKGHTNPVIIADDHAMLNAVGLPDGGIQKAREEVKDYRASCDAPLIANIVAGSTKDFAQITELAVELEPDVIEVNISCPNVAEEFGDLFSSGVESAAKMTKIVKQYSRGIPVTMKLSPNVPNIANVAKACEGEGADAITAINTLGPGMRINPELRQPILKNRKGGVSGPAILPIAIRCVWDIYEAVNIPIIGTGGITTGRDAIEMILAGATLCGVGSAVHFRGKEAFGLIQKEIEEFCQKEGITDLEEIRGKAH